MPRDNLLVSQSSESTPGTTPRMQAKSLLIRATCSWLALSLVYTPIAWTQPKPEAQPEETPPPSSRRRIPTQRIPIPLPQRPFTPSSPSVPKAPPSVPPSSAAPAPPPSAPPPSAAPTDRPQTPANIPTEIKPFETGIEFKATPPGTRITFNLEDAGLTELVRLISQITGRRFILPSKTREIKATVFAPTQVTAAEAYQAFLSILEINGLSIVPAGRYLKIVETAGIEKQPLRTYVPGEATPADDRYITRMHRLENVSAEDTAQLLGRFSSSEGSITAYAPTNTLIITDTGSNIRRMMSILENIDVPRTGEQIWIEPVFYANASDLAATLNEMFPAGQTTSARSPTPSSSAAPTGSLGTRSTRTTGESGPTTIGSRAGETRVTKILADERSNSLIIVATEQAYMRMLEIIRELDKSFEGEGRIHIHQLQHGDAEQIAKTLSELAGSGGRPARGSKGGDASGGGAPATSAEFEGQIRVTAHPANNALVITASMHDYVTLRPIIEKLDQRRRQVFIEAVIMDLTIDRSRQLGVAFHGGIENQPTDGSVSILGWQATKTVTFDPTLLTGLAVGVRGQEVPTAQALGMNLPAFGVALNAMATSSDANILATPHLIAMDNEEAEISIGENVPLQTSGFSGLNTAALLGAAGSQQSATGSLPLGGLGGMSFGAAPRQDVGTTVRITPHINDDNEIRLEIQEEISEAGASTEGSLGVRSITKRTAKTQLAVRDQETVVIGGLMRDTMATSETKIPILGDIPLLGALFRDTKRQTRKSNLLLFLTPYVVRQPSDLRAIFERKMRERQEFLDRYVVFNEEDYTPPIDYSRTRGLFAQMINEITAIEEEHRLYKEATTKPQLEHTPRSPLGAAEPSSSQESHSTFVIGPEGEELSPEAEESRPSGSPLSEPQSPTGEPTPPPIVPLLRQNSSEGSSAPPPPAPPPTEESNAGVSQ